MTTDRPRSAGTSSRPHLAVKLEIWLDKSNDGNWQKVYDYIDDGGWGNDGQTVTDDQTRLYLGVGRWLHLDGIMPMT